MTKFWYWSLENLSDTEIKSRIRGVYTCREKFLYLFWCFVEKEVLRWTDNLSHHVSLSAAGGQYMTKHVVTGLIEKRNYECFDMLWNQVVEKKRKHMAIAEPVMPQKRKVPLRRNSNGNEYFHSNHKFFYRHYNILMLLTTLLEILKNVLIKLIIPFMLNCRILS